MTAPTRNAPTARASSSTPEAKASSSTPKPKKKHDPAKLHFAWRGSMAAVGLAMVTTGVVAIFKTKVEAGPTALITIGAALFLVAAGGRAVTWFKIGETEIHTDEGREQVVEDLDQEEPVQALASVQTAAAYDPEILDDPVIFATSAELYEKAVHEALRRVTSAQVDPLVTGPFDLEVTTDGGKVAIEAKFTRQLIGRSVIKDLAERMVNREWGYSGLLLVTSSQTRIRPELILDFRERTGGKELEIVRWYGPNDDDDLRAALQGLLGRTG